MYVVFGLAGFTLRCNIREEKKVTMPTKLSECLVILSAHLSRSLTNPLWLHLRVLHETHLALS